eukprot:m.186982 g.186982  ORF g.186982 m.186982 type:complete len:758 (+) comp16946_c0_seq1:3-2276(+)
MVLGEDEARTEAAASLGPARLNDAPTSTGGSVGEVALDDGTTLASLSQHHHTNGHHATDTLQSQGDDVIARLRLSISQSELCAALGPPSLRERVVVPWALPSPATARTADKRTPGLNASRTKARAAVTSATRRGSHGRASAVVLARHTESQTTTQDTQATTTVRDPRADGAVVLEALPDLCSATGLGDVLVGHIPLRQFAADNASSSSQNQNGGSGGATARALHEPQTSKRRRLSTHASAHADTVRPSFVRMPSESIEQYVRRTGDLILSNRLHVPPSTEEAGEPRAWATGLNDSSHDSTIDKDADAEGGMTMATFLPALVSFLAHSDELHAFETPTAATKLNPSQRKKDTAVPPWLVGEDNVVRAIVATQRALAPTIEHATDDKDGGGGVGHGDDALVDRDGTGSDRVLDTVAGLVVSGLHPFTSDRAAGARLVRMLASLCAVYGRVDYARTFCLEQLRYDKPFDSLLLLTFLGAYPDALCVSSDCDSETTWTDLTTLSKSDDIALVAVMLCVLHKLTSSGRHTLAPAAALSRLSQLCGWPPLPQSHDNDHDDTDTGGAASTVQQLRHDLMAATLGAMVEPRSDGGQRTFTVPVDTVEAEAMYWVLHCMVATVGPFAAFESPLKDVLLPIMRRTAAGACGTEAEPIARLPLMVATLWAVGFCFHEATVLSTSTGPHVSMSSQPVTAANQMKKMRKLLLQTLKSDLPMAVRRAALVGLGRTLTITSDATIVSDIKDCIASWSAEDRSVLPSCVSHLL